MNIGKSTFTRIVTRYGGDQRVRTLSCAEHYRAMAIAQLTYREVCAISRPACRRKRRNSMPWAFAIRCAVDAGRMPRGARRRIYAELAQAADRPGAQAVSRRGFGVRPRQYGLRAQFDDHRSLPGGVSVGAFRTAKAAVKMHTLLDLRGSITSFIHGSNGKLHDVHALDRLLPEAAPSMSWIAATSISAGFTVCIWPARSSSRAPYRNEFVLATIAQLPASSVRNISGTRAHQEHPRAIGRSSKRRHFPPALRRPSAALIT